MPRLIISLLTLALLAILTVQNLSSTSEVPLVLVGRTVSEGVPLGWLLLAAAGIGALLTLFLYGLVGLHRPPESKYRPMGRRVPYPDSPGSASLPTSRQTDDFDTPTSTARYGESDYGRSAAFVSEPSPAPTDKPFITPPQDTSPQNTPPQNTSPSVSSSAESTFQSTTYSSNYAPSDDGFSTTQPSAQPRPQPRSFVQQPIAGLKSALGLNSDSGSGKKKDRRPADEPASQNFGDDWGELRTAEQRNSWEAEESNPSNFEAGAKSLFDFGRSVGANAGRIAEDIATGWNTQSNGPQQDRRSSDRTGGYEQTGYEQTDYDGLDEGWEGFDDYGAPPDDVARKRIYGDSLYGEESADFDEPYADDRGLENVYEAEYRVIEPPVKPLPQDPSPQSPPSQDPSRDFDDRDSRYRQ